MITEASWRIYPRTVDQLTSGQFLVAMLIAAGAGAGVCFHAQRNRIPHPSLWSIAVFLFLAVALPLYVLQVRRIRRARQVT
jgi:Flp pilus assembly protein TadB